MTKNEIIKLVTSELAGTKEVVPSIQSVKIRRSDAKGIIDSFLIYLFPEFFGENTSRKDSGKRLFSLIQGAVDSIGFEGKGEQVASEIFLRLPKIRELLLEDAIAIFEGDPSTYSPAEVVLTYPGFLAIALYRLANEFYCREIGYIPRLISEIAHERTGIDIHPGAEIGRRFAIDHGTGIVIGETAKIGDDVRLYQGVTLGAKSFEHDENGNPRKGGKRHPDVGNRCVIYAGATILGGYTVIGDDCVIGCNVILTHSLPNGQIVRTKENESGRE